MRLDAHSRLRWKNGLDTRHTMELKTDLHLDKIFHSDKPALELATHSASIRRELVALLLEGHIAQVIADTGVPSDAPGPLRHAAKAHGENSWSIDPHAAAAGPELAADMEVTIEVETDRQTHAIQALAAARAVVADVIAEQVMGALKQYYLGINETRSATKTRLRNGGLQEYTVRETGPGPQAN